MIVSIFDITCYIIDIFVHENNLQTQNYKKVKFGSSQQFFSTNVESSLIILNYSIVYCLSENGSNIICVDTQVAIRYLQKCQIYSTTV